MRSPLPILFRTAGLALTLLGAALPARAVQIETVYSFGDFQEGQDFREANSLLITPNGDFIGTADNMPWRLKGGPPWSLDPESYELQMNYEFVRIGEHDSDNVRFLAPGRNGCYYFYKSAPYDQNAGSLHKFFIEGLHEGDDTLSIPLATFGGTNGTIPIGQPLEASDGNVYGLTSRSSSDGWNADDHGTVFKYNTVSGELSTLHTFDGVGLGEPAVEPAALTQGTDGLLYGIAAGGGAHGAGAIFKLALDGTYTVLHDLAGTNSIRAMGVSLVEGEPGTFYGILNTYNESHCLIFKVTTNGTYTVLRSLSGSDGFGASGAPVWKNGYLYGTTYGGARTITVACSSASMGPGTTPSCTISILKTARGPSPRATCSSIMTVTFMV